MNLKWLDRDVLSHTNSMAQGDIVEITMTLDGDIPPKLRGPYHSPSYRLDVGLDKHLRGLDIDRIRYNDRKDQTTVVLTGSYKAFLERCNSEGPVMDNRVDLEERIQEIQQSLQREMEKNQVKRDEELLSKAMVEEAPSTLNTTRSNTALAMQVAAANLALDQMVTLLQQHLAKSDIDTTFMQSPGARALVKMALPTMVMAALDMQPIIEHIPEQVRTTLRDLMSSAQLGASIEGMQTVMTLVLPLLAEFAQVKGTLTPGEAPSMAEVLGGLGTPEQVPVVVGGGSGE